MWRWIAHVAPNGYLMVTTAILVVNVMFPEELTLSGTAVAVGLVFIGMDMQHDRVPCEVCARNVPLNGGLEAERRDSSLRLYHRRVLYWTGMALVFPVTFAAFLLDAPWLARATIGNIGLVLLGVAMRVERVHDRLELWCPYCRDDEGECDRVSAPDPVEWGTK